jgi:rhomboid protease GluP
MALIIFLAIVLGVAYRATSPEDRARLLQAALPYLQQLKEGAAQGRAASKPFHDALRQQTRWALVTPALAATNAVVFVAMLFGSGSLSNPETIVAWGGSFGPRTTNGEWWRLVAATFVHSGMLQMLVSVAALLQPGLILERIVGPIAFAAVYFASGLLASLVNLSAHPVEVSFGASGAVFGVYGLFTATLIGQMLFRPTLAIPLVALKRLAPAAAVFLLYNLGAGRLRSAEMAGMATGFIGGIVLTLGVSDRKAPARRVAAAVAAAFVIAVASAVPLRGLADVRPAIQQVISLEGRTANTYQAAVDKFKDGRINADALAQVIDKSITPELQAARTTLDTLGRVPLEHEAVVANAEEYLQLRDESWRVRSQALHKGNMTALRQADKTELASLEAFRKVKGADLK